VRFLLEGSVRKSANRVRITVQLIDASTGTHLWAEHFDGTLGDIFDLQDKVTAIVVGAIAPKLEQAEINRAKRKPTKSLDAFDHYLRGMAGVHRWTKEGSDEALSHFYRAVELDPSFAAAYGMAARCYAQRRGNGWVTDRTHDVTETTRLTQRAVKLGMDDAVALCTAGFAIAYVADDFNNGDALIDRALSLNVNLAWAWLFSGWTKVSLDQPDIAIERVACAMRLSPQDPHVFSMQTAMACAHFVAGRHNEAFSWATQALLSRPDYIFPNFLAAASGALAGRLLDAQKALERSRQLAPELRNATIWELLPFRLPKHIVMFEDGLRKAGLTGLLPVQRTPS
jgi:tetratricopeptide (TPR) repeat protein